MSFGFKIHRFSNGTWSVSLPHQCDEWMIVGDNILSNGGVPREIAIAEFQLFIIEATETLNALRDYQISE